MAAVALCVARLPSLVSLEVDMVNGDVMPFSNEHTQALAGLTALKLHGVTPEEGHIAASHMLQHIGTLTGLRCLHLWLHHSGWAPTEHGWLSGLSLLTSLHVTLDYNEARASDDLLVAALDDVASAVPRMPALAELRISDSVGGIRRDAPSAAVCARLASASGTLRALHLHGLQLPGALATTVLPQLTALTSLRLSKCAAMRGFAGFAWLAALTNLRELGYVGSKEAWLPWGMLAGLPRVDSLALHGFVDGPYLAQLCASMPQFRRLDLAGNDRVGPGLAALQRLTNLEVLDLTAAARLDHLTHLQRASSLRRCYLGQEWSLWRQGEAMTLLGQHMAVVFDKWQHQ